MSFVFFIQPESCTQQMQCIANLNEMDHDIDFCISINIDKPFFLIIMRFRCLNFKSLANVYYVLEINIFKFKQKDIASISQ